MKTANGKTPIGNFKSLAWTSGINYLTAVAGISSRTLTTRALNADLRAAVAEIAISVVISVLADAFGPSYHDFTVDEYSNLSTTASNSLPMQYSRVEVVNKDKSNVKMGSTVNTFTDPIFHALEIPVLAQPFSQMQRFAYWVHGLLNVVII